MTNKSAEDMTVHQLVDRLKSEGIQEQYCESFLGKLTYRRDF